MEKEASKQGKKESTLPASEKKEEKGSKEKDEKELKIQELTNLVKKVQADFENYKKQQEKERAAFCKYASHELIKKLLPLLDSFQSALKDKDSKEFRKGIELIYSQFWKILESEGLKPIEALNKSLDPFMHEVLLKEKSDRPEDTVIEEIQKGYLLKDAVLRPAKVKIAKPKEKKEDDKE